MRFHKVESGLETLSGKTHAVKVYNATDYVDYSWKEHLESTLIILITAQKDSWLDMNYFDYS